MHVVFGLELASEAADHLARFAFAAFVAHQAHPLVSLRDQLDDLPAALIAVRAELDRRGVA